MGTPDNRRQVERRPGCVPAFVMFLYCSRESVQTAVGRFCGGAVYRLSFRPPLLLGCLFVRQWHERLAVRRECWWASKAASLSQPAIRRTYECEAVGLLPEDRIGLSLRPIDS